MKLVCGDCGVGDQLYSKVGQPCVYCPDGTVTLTLPSPRKSGPPCFCGRDAGSGQIVAPSRLCPIHGGARHCPNCGRSLADLKVWGHVEGCAEEGHPDDPLADTGVKGGGER